MIWTNDKLLGGAMRMALALSLFPACGDDGAATSDTNETDSEGTTDGPTTTPSTSNPSTSMNPSTSGMTGDTESETTPDTTTGDTDTTDSEDTSSSSDTTEGTSEEAVCGDGRIGGDEECDEDDLGGASCDSLGRGAGTLACADDCTFDVSGCAVPAMCGNGIMEGDEECDDMNAIEGDGCSSMCELDGGDTCEAPNYIYELPYTFSGDTSDFGNEYGYEAGTCDTVANLPANNGANDVVFSFTPDSNGIYVMDFDFEGDGILWIVTDCANKDNTCVAAADTAVNGGETLYADLVAGTTYYIIMGHWGETPANAVEGPFTFTVDTCTPAACDGSFCGDNGCGGTCGCAEGEVCDIPDGETSGTCADIPPGDTCENPIVVDPTMLPYTDMGDVDVYNDNYGYSNGVCPGEEGGWNNGAEEVVYSFTPDTTATYTITFGDTWDSTVWIVTDCADIDNTCVAGQDNLFSNAAPETIITTLEAGTTYYIMGGHWENTTLGGGGPYTFTVSEPCFPAECDGTFCGDNGCGVSCDCGVGEECDIPDGETTGTCVEFLGDTCEAPFVIDPASLPYTDTNDVDLFSNNYGYSAGACPGEESGWNQAAEEVVYAFTPDVTGTYTITLAATWDSTVWVVTDCADIDSSCVAGADAELGNDDPEVIVASLTAGTTYYIMGGHFSNFSTGLGGPYTLTVSEPCIPEECDGTTCGFDDGCGGTCGCVEGEVCTDGMCEPGLTGDTCANPIIVDTVPFSDSGNTLDYENDYGYASGVCPGETGGWGAGAEDVVYAFTPTEDGSYTVTLTTTWDSTVWMVTDCGNVNGTCVAGADNGQPETFTADLTAGTTYYIMASHWENTTPGGGGTYTIDIVQN